MCGKDIWMFCGVKKHDGWGVSLHDLFLTSCCVKAPWLCNLPCGLKQCRLDSFHSITHCPSLCWAGFCFSLNLRLTLFVAGRVWPASGHTARHWPHLPFSACWSRWCSLVTPSTPWWTGEGQGGMRRVAGRQGPRSEWLGAVEGGGGGLSWRSTGLRTGCVEQAAAAQAQAKRTLDTTSANQ